MIDLDYIRRKPAHIPVVQSHGMGVDSTAVACLLVEWGIKPQLIQLADTRGEHPDTYAYIPIMNAFLEKHGLPPVTIVKRDGKHKGLEAACLHTDSLPAKAFGGSSCSLGWKVEPMEAAIRRWAAASRCWNRGDKVIKIIGFDYGDRDQARFAHNADKEDPFYNYWYPLREAKLTRDSCKAVIKNAGLPVPRKSSCWYCPAMKKDEIRSLRQQHPELVERAVTMEVNAAQGKHGLKSTKGLGRSFSWTEYLAEISPSFATEHAAELQVIESQRDHRKKEGRRR